MTGLDYRNLDDRKYRGYTVCFDHEVNLWTADGPSNLPDIPMHTSIEMTERHVDVVLKLGYSVPCGRAACDSVPDWKGRSRT